MPADRHHPTPGRLVTTARGRTGIAVGLISLLAAALLWMNPATDLAAAGIGAERVEKTSELTTDPAQVPVEPASPDTASCR